MLDLSKEDQLPIGGKGPLQEAQRPRTNCGGDSPIDCRAVPDDGHLHPAPDY